ncbi:MAG: hypothetical protein IH596_01115, partial [Bacteroidales bacterium]|nr:hypothetical protein [Bacteroidales bacterium]
MRTNLLDIHPSPLVLYQPDWIFYVLLGMFLLMAWIQLFYGPRLRMILHASFINRHLHQLEREGDLFNERISIALSILYVLSLSMVIYQAI